MNEIKKVNYEKDMSLNLNRLYDAINIEGLEIADSIITYKRGIDGDINNLMISIKDNITNIVNEFTLENFFVQGANQLNYIAFNDKAIMVNEIFDSMSQDVNSLIAEHRALTPGNSKYNHLFDNSIYRFIDNSEITEIDMNVKGNQTITMDVESSNLVLSELTKYLSGAEDLIVDCIETGRMDSTNLLRTENATDVIVFKKRVYSGTVKGEVGRDEKVIGLGTMAYDYQEISPLLETLYEMSTDIPANRLMDVIDGSFGNLPTYKKIIDDVIDKFSLAGMSELAMRNITSLLILVGEIVVTGKVEGLNQDKLETDLIKQLNGIDPSVNIQAAQVKDIVSGVETLTSGIIGIGAAATLPAVAGVTPIVLTAMASIALTAFARESVGKIIKSANDEILREGIEELLEANGLVENLYDNDQAKKDAYIKEYIQAGENKDAQEVILQATSYRNVTVDYKNSYENAYGERVSKTDVDLMTLTATGVGNGESNVIEGANGYKNILSGNGGNDVLYGKDKNDILTGGADEDLLYGGAGDDTYIYTLNDGMDYINDESGANDVLKIKGTTSINVLSTNENNIMVHVGEGQIEIEDGNTLASLERIEAQKDDDVIHYGLKGNDSFEQTQSTNDTYVYRKGDGVDTIKDFADDNIFQYRNVGEDIIYLEDYSKNAVTNIKNIDGDLILYFGSDESDQIIIKEYYNPNNVNNKFTVEKIKFADLQEPMLLKTFVDNFTLPEDQLTQIEMNYDSPWISTPIISDDTGKIQFNLNIAQPISSFKLIREGFNLIIYKNSENNIKVKNFFDISPQIIGELTFNGDTSEEITGDEIREMFMDMESEHPIALEFNNNYSGTHANEIIEGNSNGNTLYGGSGTDTLDGGEGSDRYIIKKGNGNTTIKDYDKENNDLDRVVMQDRTSSEVSFNKHEGSDDLIITADTENGGVETITIVDYYANNSNKIEKIDLSNGSWFIDDLYNLEDGSGSSTGEEPTPTEALKNLIVMSKNGVTYADEIIARESNGKCVYRIDDIASELFDSGISLNLDSGEVEFIHDNINYILNLNNGTVSADGEMLDKTYVVARDANDKMPMVSKSFIEDIFRLKEVGDQNNTAYIIPDEDSASEYSQFIGMNISEIKEALITPTNTPVTYDYNTIIISDHVHDNEKLIQLNTYKKDNERLYSMENIKNIHGIKNYNDDNPKLVHFTYDNGTENKSVTIAVSSGSIVVNSYSHESGYYSNDPFWENGHLMLPSEFVEGLLDLKIGKTQNETIYLIDEDKEVSLYNDCYGKSITYITNKLFGHVSETGGSSSNHEVPAGTDYGSDKLVNLDETIKSYIGTEKSENINGNNRDNILEGEGGNDFIFGDDGDDKIYGGEGDDRLVGYDGDDRLYGNDGDDYLSGYEDNDYYEGGNGNDLYEIIDNEGIDEINDFATDYQTTKDTVYFSYSDKDNIELSISEKNKDDLKIKFSNERDFTIIKNFMVSNAYRPEYFKFEDETVWSLSRLMAEFLNQNPSYSSEEFKSASVIVGEDNNISATLSGDADDNVLVASDANTTINAGNGDDILYGGAGDDSLRGYYGDDYLEGGSGNDYLEGGYGDDVYIFNQNFGCDSIYNSDSYGNDIVQFGYAHDDIIFTKENSDLVVSASETDKVYVKDYFKSTSMKVDNLVFNDQLNIDATNIELLIQAMSGYCSTNGVAWTSELSKHNEEVQAILSQYCTAV